MNRYIVYTTDKKGTWYVEESPWTLERAEIAYGECIKKLGKRDGGARLTAPNGEILKEHIVKDGTIKTVEQASLF